MSGNTMRWRPGRRGHYEGWFVAFNNPAEGAGYWVRYSMVAPTDPGRQPFAQVWFMRTDRTTAPRNRALRSTFPIAHLRAVTRPFSIDIAGHHLDEAGCRGCLSDDAGEVAWELTFDSLLPGFTPTPEWGARVATCFQEPQPLIRVSGVVTEDGLARNVQGWLGEQAHVFGARHSQRWHWAECKHLGAGVAFTGLTAWPRFPPRAVTSLALVGGGHGMIRNGTLEMFGPTSAHSAEGWVFDAEYALERLAGSVIPRPDDLIAITYHDPSGQPVHCYHSELADMELRYYRRDSRRSAWRLEESLAAPGAAAFEYGSVTPLPGVPLLLD